MKYKARTKTEIYANMLTIQADMAFPFERPFYENKEWREAKKVLDFGCGNAYYITKLATIYPEKVYYGCEADGDMRTVAKATTSNFSNIHILSPEELEELNGIDFFLFRLVLLHLPDRKIGYELITKVGIENPKVLVIDADDEFFRSNPEPSVFLATLSALRDKSVDRDLYSKINEELKPYGLSSNFSLRIIINNDFPHAHESMIQYMYYTAELGAGSPLDEKVDKDLIEWWLNKDAYIQYGIFGKLFSK